jgi:hypothetical protein
MRSLALASALALALVAGCVSSPVQTASVPPPTAEQPTAPVEKLIWHGHVTEGMIDIFMHDAPTEGVFWPVQQAGFLVNFSEAPQWIEVRVDWTPQPGGGSFMMHPHYLKGQENGVTVYDGYMSKAFTDGHGCIRIPSADMRAGIWPMMIHPGDEAPTRTTLNTDFTLTVAYAGGIGKIVTDELHGHHGNYRIDDRKSEPCQVLDK